MAIINTERKSGRSGNYDRAEERVGGGGNYTGESMKANVAESGCDSG